MANSDTFSFLITTDNHLGYKQDDHIRRKDSFMAFNEALQVARDKDVDFVLLGGDLFHTNRPSASVEHKCIKIIRRHMNTKVDRNTSFQRVQGEFSHSQKLKHANFEDPNIRVPYPILTIHGNHDDPTGPESQSVCEKLATCGLLNYFGAVMTQTKKIVVEPIVLEKNNIKIALYGMGFIPDAKLLVAFDKGDVCFADPPHDTYNILVVHQNRIPFNKNKCISDEKYPQFFHLIIRGHEHATLDPEPFPYSKVGGLVYQPGSTVATSISSMESAAKKIGVFSIRLNTTFCPGGDGKNDRFKVDYNIIPLECCRPIVMKDIHQKEILSYLKREHNLSQCTSLEYREYSMKYVDTCIQDLLKNHLSKRKEELQTKTPMTNRDKLSRFDRPLVRVRLEYVAKQQRFDDSDLSAKFYPNQVANKNLVLFKKQKMIPSGGVGLNVTFEDEGFDEEEQEEDVDFIDLSEEKKDSIDVMIEAYFSDKKAEEQLRALSLNEYTNAIRGSNDDGNVISKVLATRRAELLNRFRIKLTDESIAASDFSTEQQVHRWFLQEFFKLA